MSADPRVVEALESALDDAALADYVEGNFAAIVSPHVPSIVRATAGLLDDATLDVVGRVWLEKRLAAFNPYWLSAHLTLGGMATDPGAFLRSLLAPSASEPDNG